MPYRVFHREVPSGVDALRIDATGRWKATQPVCFSRLPVRLEPLNSDESGEMT